MKLSKNISWVLGIYLACLLIEWIIFGAYLWKPNDMMFAFGGDALVIYYDMVYHTCFGDGVILDGMNYPYGESIFLTDANGAITTILSWLQNLGIPVCDYVLGILHGLIIYLLPFTAIFLFFIFQRLDINNSIAFVSAILITFLSPQILRIAGHFGLAFPFVIPMAIYWAMKKMESPGFRYQDLVYGFILFFFFLNNPYLGFAATSLLMVTGVLLSIKHKSKGFSVFLTGFIPTLVGYAIIHFTDPFSDRVDMQWGFFHYYTNLQGLFYPDGSLLYKLLSSVFDIPGVQFEGKNNVGIFTTIVSISAIVVLAIQIIRKKEWSFKKIYPSSLLSYLLLSSILIYIYAANYSLYGFAKTFLEDHLGKLLMFKASGRLAWPLYFVLNIWAVYQFQKWLDKRNWDLKGRIIAIIMFSIWILDIFFFIEQRFQKFDYKNTFHYTHFQNWVKDNHINKENYQAIYFIPTHQSWNDKFMFTKHFATQFSGHMLSAMSGLPMINGFLSRAPVKSSLSAIQISGHPLLPKKRLASLPSEKSIILVAGDNYDDYTIGEKFLLEHADTLGHFAQATVLSLDLNQQLQMDYQNFEFDSLIIHESFSDSNLTSPKFLDGTTHRTTPEDSLIWQGSLPATWKKSDTIEVSIWYYMDPAYYYNPVLHIQTADSHYQYYDRNSRDTYDMWVRQKFFIPASEDITIYAKGQKPFYFDELEIRKKNSHSVTIGASGDTIMVKNYPIK